MNHAVSKILDLAKDAPQDSDFLSVLFGNFKDEVIRADRPVALFGAGSLGREIVRALHKLDIRVDKIYDNDDGKSGATILDVPVVSARQAAEMGKDALFIIASQRYRGKIYEQLSEAGIPAHCILCKPSDPDVDFIYSFSMVGSQQCIADFRDYYKPTSIAEALIKDADKIQRCYDLLADNESKDLLVTKLALIASGGNLALLKKFLQEFSLPYRQFGMFKQEGTTEDYYYFNNDVIQLKDGEVFVDVGAFDGDTVATFSEACERCDIMYEAIIAFEPDPSCHKKLAESCRNLKNVECHQLGLGEANGVIRFMTSDVEDRFAVGIEHAEGGHEIRVVTLDEFLQERRITLIKMDPGANIIPKLLRGAKKTISRQHPKLALGVYHSLQAIYDIPLLVHSLHPGYKLYLRHGTYHLADTDLFAIP